jgi:iron complex outermembrane recepter protein
MLCKYAATSILFASSISVVVSTAFAGDSTDKPPAATSAATPSPPPADTDQTHMEEVDITAKFVATGAKSAMKQDVSVLDTPVSVENYSDSFMKAIETTNVTDLYSYMTGIQRGGSTGYDLSIRGFKTTQSDKNAILVDGLPGLAGRFGSPPTVGTDHVEVVKGPASVLYGQGQPGGFVNLITKKPSAKAAAVIDVTGSAYGGGSLSLRDDAGYTVDADFTGPINAARTLLYRLILEDVHRDTFRDSAWERSTYVSPSLTWIVSDNTTATLAVEVRHRETAYDNFLVAPNKDAHLIAPITTRYQEPGDIQPERGRSSSFTLSHSFAPGIDWNTAVRSVTGSDDAVGYDTAGVFLLAASAKGPQEWVVQRRARQQHNERTYNFIDSNLSLPFTTGPVGHKLLVGGNGGIDTTDFNRIQFFSGPMKGAAARPGAGSINVDAYHPVYGLAPALSSFGQGPINDRYTRSSAYAAYLSDLLTFSEHWKATVGLRYSGERQYTAERKTPPLSTSRNSASKVLPTGGLMFEPNRTWTLYTSYSTSFVPESAGVQDANGRNSFSPESAHQVEVGTKADLLESRLSTTLALYDIHRTNVLEPIPCNAGVGGLCSQQVGAERSKGVELEINAHLLPTWQTLFGYAYTDATIERSNSSATAPLVGARLTNSSLNNLHVWSRYDIPSGALKRLGIGIGAYSVSSHTGSLPSLNDARVLLLPGYTVVDLALYYTLLDRYDFTLKVGNMFDRRYFEGVNSTTNELGVVPGAPRYILLSMRVPVY